MKTKLMWLFVVAFLIIWTGIAAEPQQKPLTNQDVIKMIELKLPESVILTKIRVSETRFNTSAEALAELSQKGVSEVILKAMLSPSEPTIGDVQKQMNAGGVVAADALRVNLISGGTTNEMVQRAPSTGAKVGVFAPFTRSRSFFVFTGEQANLRIKETTPVFEVGVMSGVSPSDLIFLQKPQVKSDSRQLPIEVIGIGAKSAVKKGVVSINIRESGAVSNYGVKLTTYRIQPTQPLKPGEYMLSVQGRFYDFGIDSPK